MFAVEINFRSSPVRAIRLASTSSRLMSPTTDRNVVAAMFWAAPVKFATCTTLACASTTLKNVMKSMEMGALSFVIAVWCGISR